MVVDVDGIHVQIGEALLKVLPPDLLIVELWILGGDDDLISPALERFAYGALVILVGIAMSRIDIVHARLKGCVQHRDRLLPIHARLRTLTHHGQTHGSIAKL